MSPQEIRSWLEPWQTRILPEKVCILGGEPLLNPKIVEIIQAVGEAFPRDATKKIIFTNGLLWKSNSDLIHALKRFGFEVRLTIHSTSPEYLEKVENIIKKIQQVSQLTLLLFNGTGKQLSGFDFSDEKWTRRYHEKDGKLYPFQSSNPKTSWEICPGKYSTQLVEGKLWKCPPVAYFRLVSKEKRSSPDWEPFNQYQGLSPYCTQDELIAFFAAEEEAICSLCPDQPQPFEKPHPVRGTL